MISRFLKHAEATHRRARSLGLYTNYADRHYNAKLNSAKVQLIRRAHDNCGLTEEELAPVLSVNARTILDVLQRKTWRSVDE